MTDHARLRLGTRQSPLAVAQAEETRRRLCEAHGWREDQVELVKVRASGDKIQDRPLADIGGKALWTRELDIWLAEGKIDAAVHSMKDVETLRPDSLTIAAILPRVDVRDVLIGASSITLIPRDAIVGTSAPRRAAQMLYHRPDCTIVSFRGNVATRLAKLAAGEADVTFLAAAGLQRLDQTGTGTPLDADDWLPAPAQGAIGIECNTGDTKTLELLNAIDHRESHLTVMAERALLEALGGTCHSPIAVLSAIDGDTITMKASLFSSDGAERVDGSLECSADALDEVRALGRDLLARGTPGITALFEGG
ncbi:hydroxymethylbilane synthase [Pontixanthobacter aestiaquae]|uniref:Porphobilinogen deaminase n=1 Tax=Pontixanthobacter aestiaquae TaxID=1509367 RepID=A0A844ZBA9_9SPHN|nr:hydroxymethylbilane synthase [Pontixanthobacter aestiaquae]MDN3644815.1 hydroxymethylbilane synthase [Pontixanthobacter aestiaquae]MXO84180.1 hydroxymethylbilane synthase [Pontixanthobacter aestiaquae]